KDAEDAYKAAETEAGKQAAKTKEEKERLEARQRDLQATEQLGTKTTDTRSKGEQAGAQRLAPEQEALPLDREKDAQAALTAQDEAGAEGGCGEAGDEFEKARVEAVKAAEVEKRERELQAQRQRDAEQARTQMTQSRVQADQADAKRYNPRLWQDALAKEGEG